MRSVRTIIRLSLTAAAALAVLTDGAAADHEGGWEEISPAHIIVNIAQETDVQIEWARQAMPERGTLLQEVGFAGAAGAEGYMFVEKSLDAPFLMESDDPALGGKSMHDMALSTLEDLAPDASVELIKKISIRGGVGHVAYVRGREHRCMVSQTAYNFQFPRAGPNRYGTVVTLSYCDQAGDSKHIVDFLKNLQLVSAADNRAARGQDFVEDSEPVAASGGSGFFVSRQGYILTNNHVIDECAVVRAQIGEMNQEVAVVAADPWNDLALLRISNPAPFDAALLREGRDADVGEGVVAVGFPLQGLLASQPNVTAGTVSATAGYENDVRFLQMTAAIQPGNSGGPLFDESGNVVGVIVAKLDALQVAELTGDIPQNVNFAIKSSVARAFLATHGVDYETAPAEARFDNADIAERGRTVTVAVECIQ